MSNDAEPIMEDDTISVRTEGYAPIPLLHKFGDPDRVTKKRIVIPGDGNDAVFYFHVKGDKPNNLEYEIFGPDEIDEESIPSEDVLEAETASDETEEKADSESEDPTPTEDETELPSEEEIIEEKQKQEEDTQPEEPIDDTPQDTDEDVQEIEEHVAEAQEAKDDDDLGIPNFEYPHETGDGQPVAGILLSPDENTSPRTILVYPTQSDGVPDESAADAVKRVIKEHEGYQLVDWQTATDALGHDPLISGD